MPDGETRKDASHVITAERERTLASAIRRRASTIHILERAFEEAGCSCGPYRRQLRELETRYDAEQTKLLHQLGNSDLAREIDELQKTIADIDGMEHPFLDTSARQAYPFLPVWMMDQVREGNPSVLGLNDQDITSSYAEAWYGGWRPKSLCKAKRSGVNK